MPFRLAALSHVVWSVWNQPALNLPLALGLWLAASDPLQHRAILATALAAKLLGLYFYFNWHDVLWILPFAWLLRQTRVDGHQVDSVIRGTAIGPLEGVFEGMRTREGVPISHIIRKQPTLLVFLRHATCPFCRQTIADLRAARPELERMGVAIALIHHSSEDAFQELDFHLIHDPRRRLYRHFGLGRGGLMQILGPTAFLRGAWAVLKERHPIGVPFDGDLFQMPGVFLVDDHQILASYYHRVAGDRPDYLKICNLVSASMKDSPAFSLTQNQPSV
jgi:peroxiredoxin